MKHITRIMCTAAPCFLKHITPSSWSHQEENPKGSLLKCSPVKITMKSPDCYDLQCPDPHDDHTFQGALWKCPIYTATTIIICSAVDSESHSGHREGAICQGTLGRISHRNILSVKDCPHRGKKIHHNKDITVKT